MDGTGLVTGVAPGTAQIMAVSEGRSTSANVTVTTLIARISVAPSPASVPAGQTVQLIATARDAADAAITGKLFAWSSQNQSIATVSQSGLVTGVVSGSTTISAAAEGVSGNVTVNVTAPSAVVLMQINPATLVEGQSATLTGSGFSATAASNSVTIDGVAALVTQASATTLTVTVPSFDCRPKGNASVIVNTGGASSNTIAHPVSPASFVALTVGQQTVISGASARCLQFDATTATERYVVGVQSISETVATLTPVTVSAGVPTGSISSEPLAVASLRPTGPAINSALESEASARWRQHLESTAANYERQRAFLEPIAASARMRSSFATVPSVPGTVQEGQQIMVRIPNYSGNTCTQSSNLTVNVRKITAQAVFLEDIGNPAPLDQSVYDQAGSNFATIYGIDVDNFGAPSDVDGNARIAIVVTKEVNRITNAPLGFVSFGDLFTSTQCPASNEGEVFYMRAPDPSAQFGTAYTIANLTGDFTHLLAHEFAHIIQGSRRRAVGAPFMVSWLAEGLATAAQEVAGFQMIGLLSGQNYGRNTVYTTLGADPRNFFGYMGDYLAYFGFDFQGNKVNATPEECSWVGSTAATGHPGPCSFAIRLMYGLPWSLIKFTIDRNLGGAANQKQYLRAFSDYTGGGGGFAELQGVLNRPIASMLNEWAPMLYIDNRYPAASAFQYANWNLRDIAAAWQTPNADLNPRLRGFAAFNDAFNVRAGSSAYYEISGTGRPTTAIRFRDGAGSPLPAFVTVWAVRVQ
ncbi:MAG: Ig-like domain-containing protein [Gemmatimonadota bacterium]